MKSYINNNNLKALRVKQVLRTQIARLIYFIFMVRTEKRSYDCTKTKVLMSTLRIHNLSTLRDRADK